MPFKLRSKAQKMKNIRFNTTLITKLEDIVFMSPNKIRKKARIPSSTWYTTIMRNPSAITIQHILAIANGMHIPVRRFFSEGNKDIIRQRDYYITEPYQDCYYDAKALQEIINSRPNVSWQKAADSTEMTRDNLRKSLLAMRRTPVTRFLTACNALGISPFDILIDPNPIWKRETSKRHTEASMDLNSLYDNLRKLSSAFDDLTDKYRLLLERYDRLESTIKEYIEGNIDMDTDKTRINKKGHK